jgi:hypothetical protein
MHGVVTVETEPHVLREQLANVRSQIASQHCSNGIAGIDRFR